MRQKECKIEERRYGSRNHGLWFRFNPHSASQTVPEGNYGDEKSKLV